MTDLEKAILTEMIEAQYALNKEWPELALELKTYILKLKKQPRLRKSDLVELQRISKRAHDGGLMFDPCMNNLENAFLAMQGMFTQ